MAAVSYFPSQCCFHCQVVEDVKEEHYVQMDKAKGVSF